MKKPLPLIFSRDSFNTPFFFFVMLMSEAFIQVTLGVTCMYIEYQRLTKQ